jgi:hypothetical protein
MPGLSVNTAIINTGQSDLSRLDFYQQYFSANTSDEYDLEVC